MTPSRQAAQHARGVVIVSWFPENLPLDDHGRIRRENNRSLIDVTGLTLVSLTVAFRPTPVVSLRQIPVVSLRQIPVVSGFSRTMPEHLDRRCRLVPRKAAHVCVRQFVATRRFVDLDAACVE